MDRSLVGRDIADLAGRTRRRRIAGVVGRMTAPPVVHYTEPGWWEVACGLYANKAQVVRQKLLVETYDSNKTTCKNCRKTKAWREAQG